MWFQSADNVMYNSDKILAVRLREDNAENQYVIECTIDGTVWIPIHAFDDKDEAMYVFREFGKHIDPDRLMPLHLSVFVKEYRRQAGKRESAVV